MRKDELIKLIEALPEGAEVMLPGYEGGVFSGAEFNKNEHINLNQNDAWYYGPHETYGGDVTAYVLNGMRLPGQPGYEG